VAEKSTAAGHQIADTSKKVGNSVKDGAVKTKSAVAGDGSKPKE
jgi:hypothetical protein